jgi:hypothetical protein
MLFWSLLIYQAIMRAALRSLQRRHIVNKGGFKRIFREKSVRDLSSKHLTSLIAPLRSSA